MNLSGAFDGLEPRFDLAPEREPTAMRIAPPGRRRSLDNPAGF
jgi:hypothetical protein